MNDAATAASPTLPRWPLVLVSAAHSAVLCWAAWALPWREGTGFALAAGALGLGHAAVAVLAAAGRPQTAGAWRCVAWASLALLAWLGWRAAGAAVYVAELYGGLGQGVAVAVATAGAGVVLFTLPVACWSLARTGGLGPPRRVGIAVAVLVLLAALGLWRSAAQARARPPGAEAPGAPTPAGLAAALERALEGVPAGAAPPGASLYTPQPARCPAPPAEAAATLLVTFAARPGGAATAHCLQAAHESLPDALAALLAARAAAGAVKLDWVTGVRALRDDLPAVDSLKLRPGLDGVCRAGACLAPWQLVAQDQFGRYRPLPFVRDLRFGVSPRALHTLLGGGEAGDGLDGLVRIETASFARDADGALHPLRRLREPGGAPADGQRAAAAARAAQRHVLAAQQPDGAFRYHLDPFTGARGRVRPRLARQAGTTLALCELGDDPRTPGAARRALAYLAQFAHWRDGVAALARDPARAHIGRSALPLAALLACRAHVGARFDALIGGLGRLLLALQRPDGGFHPEWDARTGAPRPGPEPLFAGGQVVLALVGLEALARSGDAAPQAALPPGADIARAVDRAMTWYATRYWSHALSDFFFLEENWHCLAARAALPHHRHDAYERFCLDYVSFKSRLVLEPGEGVAEELVGGYGFGNVLPPHTTPTAGFAEALAAAAAVKRARGGDVEPERRLMAHVLGFLVRQQWNAASCFACAPGREALGGFSESPASPRLRIDYVQHAWAALAYGGALLSERG